MRPFARALSIGVVALSCTGCMTAFRVAVPGENEHASAALLAEAVQSGLQIRYVSTVSQAKFSWRDLIDPAGGAADFLVGFNLPLALIMFGDPVSAYLVAGAAGLALSGGDYLMSSVAAQRDRLPKLDSGGLWLARVSRIGGTTLATAPLRPAAGSGSSLEMVATVDLPEAERTSPLRVEIVAPGGSVVRQVDRQFSAGSWGQPAEIASTPRGKDSYPDVDSQPPRQGRRNPDSAAVIIGVEKYGNAIPAVNFARRDALSIRDHAVRVLGVPEENIVLLVDEKATKGAIETAIEAQLPGLTVKGETDVFVYFAGHGVPDLRSKTPYLVPHDGNPDFPTKSCYPLDAMYRALGALRARTVTVMLDACFTGTAARGDTPKMLVANARPLFVTAIPSTVPPGVSVLAAAAGDQISSGLAGAQHGLFTYYLLRGLRGDAFEERQLTLGGLQSFVAQNVVRQAKRMGRTQTPVLLGGEAQRVLAER